MANTKLTRDEKEFFKELKKDYPYIGFADNGENLVCAWMKKGDNIRFAFAITSPDEQKFRRKVGQFLAMNRILYDGDNEATMLPEDNFNDVMAALDMYSEESKVFNSSGKLNKWGMPV